MKKKIAIVVILLVFSIVTFCVGALIVSQEQDLRDLRVLAKYLIWEHDMLTGVAGIALESDRRFDVKALMIEENPYADEYQKVGQRLNPQDN